MGDLLDVLVIIGGLARRSSSGQMPILLLDRNIFLRIGCDFAGNLRRYIFGFLFHPTPPDYFDKNNIFSNATPYALYGQFIYWGFVIVSIQQIQATSKTWKY